MSKIRLAHELIIILEVCQLKRCLDCHKKVSKDAFIDKDGWAFCEDCKTKCDQEKEEKKNNERL